MKFELNENEFSLLYSGIFRIIELGMKQSHEARMHNKSRSFQSTDPVKTHTPPSPKPVAEAEPKEVTFSEKSLTDHQANGKENLKHMLTFWLKNYREENQPQPDRGEYVEKLACDGVKAGSIVSYSMAVGGLTRACWNVLQELYENGSIDEKHTNKKAVRYIAGNITQVASVHLAPLADQFEYPNPLEQ